MQQTRSGPAHPAPVLCKPHVKSHITAIFIQMALGVVAFDGGAAAVVHDQSLVHRSQGVLTQPL